MEKKLFWSLSDNVELENLIIDLSSAMGHIEADMDNINRADAMEMEYTLKPVWMTQEEFDKLPEYQF